MSIRLTNVRIENFKIIKEADFPVYYSNVFFGKNNSGKSAILKAIYLALDNNGKIQEKDVHNTLENPRTEDTKVSIELLFEPEDINATKFETKWQEALEGCLGKYAGKDREIFAIRKDFTFNKITKKYDSKIYWMKTYAPKGKSEIGGEAPSYIFDFCINAFYLDATLDEEDNLEASRAFIDEVLNNIQEFKKIDLNQFSDDVVQELKKFDPDFAYKSIFDTMSDLTNRTSSVLIYLVYKAQINLFNKLTKTYHSILLIEEPETHMHPQAQMELMTIVKEIEGQKYICTHSPYIVNHYPIHKLIRVVNDGENTNVYRFSTRINSDELRAINLKCMTYKSEMIFANKVILYEGQTEHIALPIYFKKYFGCYPFEKGYSFVYVEGDSNYKAYLQICNALHIDWYIFSDGEPIVVDFLNKMMRGLTHNNQYDVLKDPRIVMIPNGLCYEEDLAYHGFAKDVSNVIDAKEKYPNFVARRIKSSSWDYFKQESRKYKPEYPDFEQCVAVQNKKHKTDYAEAVANEICKNHEASELPAPVLELFEKLEK